MLVRWYRSAGEKLKEVDAGEIVKQLVVEKRRSEILVRS
jgi:hypothetical protein